MKITPNQITIARIAVLPFAIWTLYFDSTTWHWISWLIFGSIAFSDILDGKLARSRKQVTEFGAFLDPIADKLLVASAMIPMSLQGRFPWWATILILIREVGITLFRGAVLRSGVIPANRGGKVKSLLQNLGIGWFIAPLPAVLDWFKYGWLMVAIALTYITGYWYLHSWWRGKGATAE